MTSTRSIALIKRLGQGWPEILLALLAFVAFLGFLGSPEIWSPVEQRATAAAIELLDQDHWLAQRSGDHTRADQPPLTRWILAAVIAVTGHRVEWVVRLPGALSGLAIIALVYALGRRMGGRSVGLASAFVLCSMVFFVGEIRQAGEHGPVALLLTLTIYAVSSTLHAAAASRAGLMLVYGSLGLGFLAGGFSFLCVAAIALLGALATARHLRMGLAKLWNLPAFLLFLAITLSWPVAVLILEPASGSIWRDGLRFGIGRSSVAAWSEMTRFSGLWPELALPWTPIALLAVFFPLIPQRFRGELGRDDQPIDTKNFSYGLSWWWAMGSLLTLSPWASSRSVDLVPCLPGLALLIGEMWVRLTCVARCRASGVMPARIVLQSQWVLMFFVAAILPLFARAWVPAELWPWSLAISAVLAVATVVSVIAWRRGADALALAPITVAFVVSVSIVYGVGAPRQNLVYSHRALAQTIERIIPPDVQEVKTLDVIDDGLRFYLDKVHLAPLSSKDTGPATPPSQTQTPADQLIAWLNQGHPGSSFVLLHESVYSRIAARLGRRVTPLVREAGLERDELVLLRVEDPRPTQTAIIGEGPVRR